MAIPSTNDIPSDSVFITNFISPVISVSWKLKRVLPFRSSYNIMGNKAEISNKAAELAADTDKMVTGSIEKFMDIPKGTTE